MYVVCFHVCSRPVKGKSGDDASRLRMEVLHLIHLYQRQDLWWEVNSLILDDGQLGVSGALTRDNIDDLLYLLATDVAAETITELK